MGPNQYGENPNRIFKMCRIQLKNHTAIKNTRYNVHGKVITKCRSEINIDVNPSFKYCNNFIRKKLRSMGTYILRGLLLAPQRNNCVEQTPLL